MQNSLPRDADNLEKVRSYLEAFHHLCEVSAWEKAGEILFFTLNTSTDQDLSNQLGTWGYYREQIELYKRLLGKFDSNVEVLFLNGLGNSYIALGDYYNAIKCHQRNLEIAQANHDSLSEIKALVNLGQAYYFTGDYPKAIESCERSLFLADKHQDAYSVGVALTNLGLSSYSLG